MLKNGKEALLVAFITGSFSALVVLLKDLSPVASIIMYVIMFAAVYIIIWKSMTRIRESVGDPKTHPVFYTIDSGVRLAFDYLPIRHEGKKKLVILYIKTKFIAIREALSATIEDGEIRDLPIRVTSAIASVRNRLEDRAPAQFLDKMSEWDNKHNSWTAEAMYSIIESSFYADKSLKYAACFDCVQVMVKSTFIAVENAINELNGDLEKYLDGRNDV